MSQLLKKPFGTLGKVHQITPQDAGWRYVGFRFTACAGETASRRPAGTRSFWS